MASGSSKTDDNDKPYTVEELERIITVDSGGMTMLPSEAYNEVYPNLYIGEDMASSSNTSDMEQIFTIEDLHRIITANHRRCFLFPSDAYNEVYPNLFLGAESIAKSRSQLKHLGITHILNTAQGKDDGFHVHTNHVMYSRVDITYLGIEATDMFSFNLAKYFDKCADFIDQALQNGGKVMVNCKQGASRSATIVLAFLMIKRHMTVAEATRLVRSKREICPNDGFLQQLCDLNEKLKARGHFQWKKENLKDNTDTDVT